MIFRRLFTTTSNKTTGTNKGFNINLFSKKRNEMKWKPQARLIIIINHRYFKKKP